MIGLEMNGLWESTAQSLLLLQIRSGLSFFSLSHSFLPFFFLLPSTSSFLTCISLKACLIRWQGVKHGGTRITHWEPKVSLL